MSEDAEKAALKQRRLREKLGTSYGSMQTTIRGLQDVGLFRDAQELQRGIDALLEEIGEQA